MKLSTCITTVEGNTVKVTELTDGQQYLPDGSSLTAKNRFVYSDTASIDIFRLNATDNIDYTNAVIVDRSNPKDVILTLNRDGWFTSIHIVVPTKQWVYNELSKRGSIVYTYDTVYFVDGDEIYTCTKGAIERSSLQKLLDETSDNTTISRVDTDYVSITNLNTKSTELYKTLFENRMYNGGCKTDACEANRLEAIINLVKHYVRWGQLAEAERVIEKSDYFNNKTSLKKPSQNKRISSGCGCQ